MKIVVTNPIGVLSSGEHAILFPSRWDWAGPRHHFSYYPYELAYLSTLLKRECPEHEVKMLDPNHLQLNWWETVTLIEKESPDLIVTECSAMTYPDMTKAVQLIQDHGSESKHICAWLCGPYGAKNWDRAAQDGWDVVFNGEYEHKALAAIQGRPWATGYVDLDSLPWPEDNDIRRIEYSEISNPHPGMVQLYCTRGCPLACTFCVVPTYYGGHGNSYGSHRVRDIGNICDEIAYLAKKYDGQFSGCFFNEETHNANPEWLASFCEELIRRGLDRYYYDAMCGYWTFTEELIKLMARAGYCYIRMGIESLAEGVGRAIHKRVFPEKLIKVLEWCKKYGIETYGTSQIGAPGSTQQGDYETLQGLLDLKRRGLLNRWQHSVSTPQPGTPMYEQAKANGQLLHEDISRFNGMEAVMEWPGYSAAQINAMKHVYANAECEF